MVVTALGGPAGAVSGEDFHCVVGDCGVYADHCVTGEQPASLAEFNFDTADGLAPWYDVSYGNAFSLPITIEPVNATVPPGSGVVRHDGLPGGVRLVQTGHRAGQQTMDQCASCSGFTIAFHG
ncbi:thaumatin family protein [Amycolatopsis tolypomycina]|uniref:thaumatin family protein n=1 Tax=Amycolatopsis tolypomycina TaxID=208445 RepID=UPI0033A6D539